MFNYEKIAEACKGLTSGEMYECSQIVGYVHQITGICKDSIIPSDYCYNITNRGADGARFRRWPRLFIHEGNRLYRYIGEGFCYNGKVKYAKSNEDYGLWINGVFRERQQI